MPELPEVETIRRDLQEVLAGQRIKSLQVLKHKLVKNNSLADFENDLIDCEIIDARRIGKLLYFKLSNGKFLVIHLKMTGQLIFQSSDQIVSGGHDFPKVTNDLPNKYSHVIFDLADGSKLFFNDQRQFGYLKTVQEDEMKLIYNKFGIEPLQTNFTISALRDIFKNRKANIKSILLNQQLISGLGNIYVDEICFAIGVRPDMSVKCLSAKDVEAMHAVTEQIIDRAVKARGTTFRNYTDSKGKKGKFSDLLNVYGRADKKCVRCENGIIQKIKVAGRGTHFCPNCQRGK